MRISPVAAPRAPDGAIGGRDVPGETRAVHQDQVLETRAARGTQRAQPAQVAGQVRGEIQMPGAMLDDGKRQASETVGIRCGRARRRG